MNAVVTPFENAAHVPASRPRSEATKVEQSRAIAEVQAAVVVAQNRPRDKAQAIAEMRDVCQIAQLAERAFFKFPRGGQTITGASVHLARELARCWGNIDYGVKELSRDDSGGISEMLAFAWDLETNARSETTFIVPHKRDKKGGPERLTDMRDIYENNANNAARRLRECIFGILPVWFTEQAQEICRETMETGGGIPLNVRIANAIDAFAKIAITKGQLEHKVRRPSNEWIGEDIAELTVTYKSIKRGELTKEDAFPDKAAALAANADGFEQASAGKQPAAKKAAAERPVEQAEAGTVGTDAKSDSQNHTVATTDDNRPAPAFTLISADGEPLAFDDPADLPKAYREELEPIWEKGDGKVIRRFDVANAELLAGLKTGQPAVYAEIVAVNSAVRPKMVMP